MRGDSPFTYEALEDIGKNKLKVMFKNEEESPAHVQRHEGDDNQMMLLEEEFKESQQNQET